MSNGIEVRGATNNNAFFTVLISIVIISSIMYNFIIPCRDRSSMAITGEGLAMAGVGYDLQSLSIPKFGTTTTNPKKLKKKALKRALAEQEAENIVKCDDKKFKIEES
jgi:hypothetical protein